jgi:DNA-directed RNA polymerase alpha subunit
MEGVTEDVTEIVLNVKSLVLRLQSEGPKTMKVSAKKAGVVTAADIVADPAIEVINKDMVLATLTEDINFEMEMVVENGRGYMPASERIAAADRFEQELGKILIDAVYSPVTRVRYTTEDTRVGQRTNYDRLILEIWTFWKSGPTELLHLKWRWWKPLKYCASTSTRSYSISSLEKKLLPRRLLWKKYRRKVWMRNYSKNWISPFGNWSCR